jgi:uncharacterized repeat protein (TIGR03803 family)
METHFQPRLSTRISTLALLAAATALAPPNTQAQTFKTLYAFTGGSDGGVASSGVVRDKAGNLYGETWSGGDAGCFYETCGVVFQLTPGSGGWSESVLHTFTGGEDGGNPTGGLTLNADGDLLGVANVGGVSCGATYGCGVAFELSPGSGGWTETVLYSFQGGMGGYYPIAGLVFGKDGNLYTTMLNGGTENAGLVGELTDGANGWNEEVLYSLGGNHSGSEPVAAPIFDSAGNLYGTTSCCNSGAVWELQHGSWKEKTLYDFRTGGDDPWSGLVFDKAGSLYGTTREGGGKNQSGKGVVFELSRSKGGWKETVLHVFRGGTDGSTPLYSTLVFDKSGNIYGTTTQGGDPACNCGAVFRLTRTKGDRWKETVIHRFTGGGDGGGPEAGLIIDAAGTLYGTTVIGGNPGCYTKAGCGVVFEITP